MTCRAPSSPITWVEQTSVCPECCSTAHIFMEEAWSYNATIRDLHWLRVQHRIEYKIAVLVYQCFHGLARAPAYLSSSYRASKQWPHRNYQPSAIALFQSFPHESEMLSFSLSRCHLCRLSASFQTSAEDGALRRLFQLHLTNLSLFLRSDCVTFANKRW